MSAPAQWSPVRNPRAERIAVAVAEALARYAAVLETDAPFRGITIEIKMRDDGTGVRTVLVSFQGEVDSRFRS